MTTNEVEIIEAFFKSLTAYTISTANLVLNIWTAAYLLRTDSRRNHAKKELKAMILGNRQAFKDAFDEGNQKIEPPRDDDNV